MVQNKVQVCMIGNMWLGAVADGYLSLEVQCREWHWWNRVPPQDAAPDAPTLAIRGSCSAGPCATHGNTSGGGGLLRVNGRPQWRLRWSWSRSDVRKEWCPQLSREVKWCSRWSREAERRPRWNREVEWHPKQSRKVERHPKWSREVE